MRYEYDRDTDILTIVLRGEAVEHGEQAGTVVTHAGPDGKLAELEVLQASDVVIEILDTMLGPDRDPRPGDGSKG